MSEPLEKKSGNGDQEERANGDELRVTGSGTIYVKDPEAFITSQRVQKTISDVNKALERVNVAEKRE
ncbi:MAG: hypothetical protein F4210_00490 [Holophagales bacterium]|nr:hypothetical protein [Holophagales bacterium]MYF93996.1 hypothetical protein [Holophagales bacterium]